MTQYQVTIGYKAVLTVNVKAGNEKDASEIAMIEVEKMRDKISSMSRINLETDNYSPKGDGVVNMDKTWNLI